MAEPKVRFKKDDGCSYPAWTAGKLGDITEKVDRKAPQGSTAPVMMVSQGNGFIYQADKYSRENAGQSLKNYTLLKQGEFAYNHGASKAKPYGVAYCLTEEHEARVPFVYHTFRILDGVNPYWHEALNTSKMDRQLKRMVSSGARMDGLLNINYDTYMDVDVNIPCIEEQQKIADFLSSVDEIISTSVQEVANLETQKKAVMKKIFSQEVRFKKADETDFPEWEEKQIINIAPLQRGFDLPASELQEGSYPVVYSNGIGAYHIAYKCEGDAVITGRSGTTGSFTYLKNCKYWPHNTSLWVTDFCGNDSLFIYYWYQSVNVSRFSTGTGVPTLNRNNIHEALSSIPKSIEEQRLIADFLSDFDEAIAAAKKELELWKELKKGLLQQMFV